MESLTDYCPRSARCSEEMVPVSGSASLRLVTFLPTEIQHQTPIVCVPGLVTHISCWKEILHDLAKDHVVYYLETREKNSSIVAEGEDFSLASLTRDLIGVLSHLRLKAGGYILFGSSLGANIILESCRHPSVKPAALVLIGPNAEFQVPILWKSVVSVYPPALYPLLKPAIKWYYRVFRVDARSDPVQYRKYCDEVDTSDPRKLKRVITAFDRYDVWPGLREIPYSTLIIGAAKDKLHAAGISRNISSHLPRGSYVEFETNTEAHGRGAANALREFLARLTEQEQDIHQ